MRVKVLICLLVVLLAALSASARTATADDSTPPNLPNLGSGSGDGGEGTADGAPAPVDPDDGDGGSDPSPVDNPDPSPTDQPSDTPTTTTEEPPTTTETTTIEVAPPPSYCEATPTADIGVSAAADRSAATVGSMVNYTMDVFDNGPCSAPDASFTLQVPPQLELLSPNQVNTSVGSCAVTGGVGSQLITCLFGTLEKDQHVSVSVSVRADLLGSTNAHAEVGTTVSDWNVGDNQRSDVTVSVSASPNQSAAHQRMSQSRETVRTQGLLWDGRTFRSTDAFAGWLSARGSSWDRFAQNHPAAAGGLNDRG